MPVLAVREEIILSSLLILGGRAQAAPLRKKVVELSKREIVYGTLYNLLEVLIRRALRPCSIWERRFGLGLGVDVHRSTQDTYKIGRIITTRSRKYVT